MDYDTAWQTAYRHAAGIWGYRFARHYAEGYADGASGKQYSPPLYGFPRSDPEPAELVAARREHYDHGYMDAEVDHG